MTAPVAAWNQLTVNLITFRKNPKVVGLENGFFHRITALTTEEVGTCNFSCDGRDEAPSVVSYPRTRLVGETKSLKNREIGVEKPSSLFVCRLGKEVVHPKRDSGIREGVPVRIVGMIIASQRVSMVWQCVRILSPFSSSTLNDLYFFEHAVVFSSLYQSVVKYDSVFLSNGKFSRKRAIVCVCISLLKSFFYTE